MIRNVLLVVLLLVLIGVGAYLYHDLRHQSRLPGASIGAIQLTPTPLPPTPTPTPGVRVGVTAVVTGTGVGLRVHETADVNSALVITLRDGALVQILQGPVSAGGYQWYQVSQQQLNLTGWVVGNYLAPAPSATGP